MRTGTYGRGLFVALLPLALAACSGGGGGTGGNGGTAGTGGTGGSGGSTTSTTSAGGSTGTLPVCEGPGYGGNEETLTVGVVKATIKDQDGNPAAQTSAQVCGTDICYAETTNDVGLVTVVVNKPLKAPAFKYGDGIVYAKLAVPVPAGDTTFNGIVTSKLPDAGDGEKLEAGSSAHSAGLTIDIEAGSSVEIDGLTYPEDIDQLFRAVEVPIGPDVPAIPEDLGLEAVWGVAPLETVFCPAAKVHVPNTPGWAPGATVEFVVHGLDIAQHWAPYGGWVAVSEGTVSADGTEIVTVDGGGLPILSTFGVRLKN